MERVVKLDTLKFGAPAAERDIDIGLGDYFLESPAFQRIATCQKTILIGNRGTGKSAIFKVLAQREKAKGALVLELNPEDYSYEMLQRTLKSEGQGSWSKQGAFTAAWKYLIYVMIMKGLARGGGKLKTGAAGRVYSYLRDNHKGEQPNPIATLISYLKRIEGFKVGPVGATVKTRELAQLYRIQELDPLLPDIVDLAKSRRVLVFIDELDRGWDASEDARSFVAGLFQASVSINEKLPNVTVYVSLRQELYENIPSLYDDAQKYRDIVERISWNEASLRSIVARRIRHTVPELVSTSDEEAWNRVFSETLDYRNAKSFNYMVDRTLYRPREIIQFCSDALETAHVSGEFPIQYATLTRAEWPYSEGRSKDIAAEYRFQYPGLLSIFELFRGRSYAFDRDSLELLCLEITMGDRSIDPSAVWAIEQDHTYLIDVLWRVGFLRALAVGGLKAERRSGSSYVGPHQVAHLNLGSISRFQVHPMFRTYLSLKEPKG